MSSFTESEIREFAIKVILAEDNPINTGDLMGKLRLVMNPSGDDLEILPSRNDDRFSQKVRNLKSHDSLAGHADESKGITYKKGFWEH